MAKATINSIQAEQEAVIITYIPELTLKGIHTINTVIKIYCILKYKKVLFESVQFQMRIM
jgi:hypothetical protein